MLAFEVVIETSMQARSIGKPATQKNSNPEVRENTMSPRGGKIYILYRYVSLKKEVRILDFFLKENLKITDLDSITAEKLCPV